MASIWDSTVIYREFQYEMRFRADVRALSRGISSHKIEVAFSLSFADCLNTTVSGS